MTYIDLTHTFTSDMPAHPGDAAPQLRPTDSIEKQGYRDFLLTSGMHTGTHMEGPAHMLKDGKLLSDFPAGKFFGRGVLIDARGKEQIDIDLLTNHPHLASPLPPPPRLRRTSKGEEYAFPLPGGEGLGEGDIVLILTGWSQKFGTDEYYRRYPAFTEAFSRKLVELGISIVGMDSPSPDYEPYQIHKIFFPHDILLIENLTNLESLLKSKNFEVTALPAKFATDAAFCRVVAKIN